MRYSFAPLSLTLRNRLPMLFHGTRFMIVAWIGMGVNTACLYLFKGLWHLPIIPASLAAIEIAIIHNFLGMRYWAWRDRGAGGNRPPLLRQLLLYNVATGVVDLCVNVSVLWMLYRFFGVHYLLANLAGMIMGPFVKFWLNDKVVFREAR